MYGENFLSFLTVHHLYLSFAAKEKYLHKSETAPNTFAAKSQFEKNKSHIDFAVLYAETELLLLHKNSMFK
jgi:hypothetical protein